MGTCINHPDRETPYICMKHQIYLCEACLECRDPKIYCKHRSACPIWFMSKRKMGWDAEDKQEALLRNPNGDVSARGADGFPRRQQHPAGRGPGRGGPCQRLMQRKRVLWKMQTGGPFG
jgi:hypothetical protein